MKLRLLFPSFRQVARGNPYIWEGSLRPNGGMSYRIHITYRHGRRPVVEIIEPALVPRVPGERIPHTFRAGAICLHLLDEWNATMWIHETIIPWASLWLYYYELWHATGEWLGGGHGDEKDAVSRDRLGVEGDAQ